MAFPNPESKNIKTKLKSMKVMESAKRMVKKPADKVHIHAKTHGNTKLQG